MQSAIVQSLQPPRASSPVLVPCQKMRHFCVSSRTRTLLHDASGAHASAAPEPAGQRAYLRCTAHSHTHIALNSARLDVFGRAHGCGRHSEENEWLKWKLRAGTVERLTLLVRTPTTPGKLRLLRSSTSLVSLYLCSPFLYADLSISLNCNSKVTELKHTNWGAPLKGRRVWIRLNVLYVHLNP